MKKWEIVTLSLLGAVIICLGLLSFIDGNTGVSSTENRALAEKPELTVAGVASGSFSLAYDEYYADNFPFREFFIGVNRMLNKIYYYSGSADNTLILDFESGAEKGGESLADVEQAMSPAASEESTPGQTPEQSQPSDPPDTQDAPEADEEEPTPPEEPPELIPPDISEATGTDGTIIIVGDNAMDIPYASPKVITYYARVLSELAASLDGTSNVYSLITPNSGEFYSPVEFHTGDRSQKDMIDSAYRQMAGVITVDAYSKLRMHTDEYIFFRTDHHWTQLGAYYAYTAFCDASGFEAALLSEFQTGLYDRFVGSMYNYTSAYAQSEALWDNPDYLEYYLPIASTGAMYYQTAEMTDGVPIDVVNENISETYANKYLCFISGDTPLCVVDSDVDGPVCAVIKESYGNAFVPFLTSHYSKIYVIDPREFNTGGAAFDLTAFSVEHGIDDIIVINYPFMINNAYYTGQIELMIGDVK